MVAQVKWALGQNQTHGGLLQVEVPDPNDPTKQIMAVTKETLEHACLNEA